MANLRSLLERLGAPGAARNAELAIRARRDEDLLVESLVSRLGDGPGTTAAQVA